MFHDKLPKIATYTVFSLCLRLFAFPDSISDTAFLLKSFRNSPCSGFMSSFSDDSALFVVAKLTRDLSNAINRNDNEVQELQAIIHQNKINAEHELERRVTLDLYQFS